MLYTLGTAALTGSDFNLGAEINMLLTRECNVSNELSALV